MQDKNIINYSNKFELKIRTHVHGLAVTKALPSQKYILQTTIFCGCCLHVISYSVCNDYAGNEVRDMLPKKYVIF